MSIQVEVVTSKFRACVMSCEALGWLHTQLILHERGVQVPYHCEGKCTIAQSLFYQCTNQVQVGSLL